MKCALAIGAALIVAVPIMTLPSGRTGAASAADAVPLDLSTLDAGGAPTTREKPLRAKASTIGGLGQLTGLSKG
ncbi:hypothetical protein [Rhizorhabdus sp.]|uniref:hypothetical protein n=1 Tax=Rhizorhabdus sp. TaxID=1968843 RepID=UPI001B5B7637|nr:hypothetical protein [Rhizorhabdus sp.]MBP8230754.1 hypothetical protein [Rhizorhabdus sp.]